MKKYAIVLGTLLFMLTGCGNSNKNEVATESKPVSDNNAIETADSAEAEVQESIAEDIPAEKNDTKEEPVNWGGIMMPLPDGFAKDTSMSDNEDLYKGGTDEQPLYYAMDVSYHYDDYLEEEDNHDYTVSDVPDIMLEELNSDLDFYFSSSKSLLENNVRSSEETEFLGFPALHVTGVLNTSDGMDEEHIVSYSAYYSIIDFEEDDALHTPSFWICYTEGDSDELIKKLEDATAVAFNGAYKAEG